MEDFKHIVSLDIVFRIMQSLVRVYSTLKILFSTIPIFWVSYSYHRCCPLLRPTNHYWPSGWLALAHYQLSTLFHVKTPLLISVALNVAAPLSSVPIYRKTRFFMEKTYLQEKSSSQHTNVITCRISNMLQQDDLKSPVLQKYEHLHFFRS